MRPPSIFVQVLGLSLLILLVALGLGAVLAQVLPAPDRGRMNVAEMAWALDRKPSSVIDVATRSSPPGGLRSTLVERSLAEAMGRPASEVRVVWKDLPGAAEGSGQNVLLIDGRDVLVTGSPGGFVLTYGDHAKLDPDTFVPLFQGAVRTEDGGWRTGTPRDPARAAWRVRILIAFVLAALLLAGPVWWIARRIARPIEALARAADDVRLASSEPFALSGPREVRTAAAAINAMHARLVGQAREQLRMVAALAHDLRTPLTALRLRAEEAPPALAGRMRPDLRRMATMIEDCLALTGLGARPVVREPTRLDHLIAHCAASRDPAVVSAPDLPSVTVVTDPVRLQRAIDNLIDNAVRYGGRATVRLETTDEAATISIEDEGPGLPEGQIDRLLRPFETMDPARSRSLGGVGLGLSIVSEISREIGAEFVLENAPAGLSARLIFSRTAQPLAARLEPHHAVERSADVCF